MALALAGAFTVSAGVVTALAATGLLPPGLAGEAGPIWVFHLVGLGTVALALADRLWARWMVAGLTAGYLVIGVQLYAVLFVPGLLTTVGWFATDVHLGLLALAECLCVRRLVIGCS